MRNWCECEHISHLEYEKTPNGKEGHDYGIKSTILIPVKTPFGTFNVCPDCANDCYSPEQLAKLME